MSSNVGQLASWLLQGGYAEERPGYGHRDAQTLADELLTSEWAGQDDIDLDALAAWLVANGHAEERRGYGHVDGETLAEALADAGVLRDGA